MAGRTANDTFSKEGTDSAMSEGGCAGGASGAPDVTVSVCEPGNPGGPMVMESAVADGDDCGGM